MVNGKGPRRFARGGLLRYNEANPVADMSGYLGQNRVGAGTPTRFASVNW